MIGDEKYRIGIDAGSLYLKIVVIDEKGNVLESLFSQHKGNLIETLIWLLNELNLNKNSLIGMTGEFPEHLLEKARINPINPLKADVTAVRKLFPYVRNIINVGGCSIKFIQFNEKGEFLNFGINSLCASGTGSFLDQQAERLGIKYEYLKNFPSFPDPPTISTRCSVFAKTDLISRQQEGFSREEMWSGLCRGMAYNLLNTLLKGKKLNRQTVIIGGVSLNSEILRWLKSQYSDLIFTWKNGHLAGAIGSALLADKDFSDFLSLLKNDGKEKRIFLKSIRPALLLIKSKYPYFEEENLLIDDLSNEIRINKWPEKNTIEVYMGIDVGSTSTKAVLIDKAGNILMDIYRKTEGDPVQAVRNLFIAIEKISKEKKTSLEFLGAGTTGSGRKMIGLITGADFIINEITSHLRGASYIDPEVETIFEIGGQDSKYTRVKDQLIHDSNMNYVCAAGTGSFIEEQAKKLGYEVSQIGDLTLGTAPPYTSDRCTVFMEQDIFKLLKEGYTKKEVMAAVMYSVAQNYLRNVVGNRHISKKIFFQGATARNKALVAAFENILNREISVPSHCHVMGAYGVALIAKESRERKEFKSKFKGLDLAKRKLSFSNKNCGLCSNNCRITYAHIEGEKETPSWGYMCGREPWDTRKKLPENFYLFQQRNKFFFKERNHNRKLKNTHTIGIPRSLSTYLYYPFFKEFLLALGFNVRLSPVTNPDIVKRGCELSGAETCFPVKISIGSSFEFFKDRNVNFVFIPHMISAEPNPKTTNSLFCPYLEAAPSLIQSSIHLQGLNSDKILSPVFDFRLNIKESAEKIYKTIGEKLEVKKEDVFKGLIRAKKTQEDFEKKIREKGTELLKDLEEKDEIGIVILGRPYNIFDQGINLDLPYKISQYGYKVIPLDCLPVSREEIDDYFSNMYWAWGQKILAASKFIKNHKNLFAVYLTNFNCGPDSFLLSYFETILEGKPFLILEIDEHGADTGYITRIEAFLDVLRNYKRGKESLEFSYKELHNKSIKERKLWIPAMHPIGSQLFASAFRRYGYMAEALSPENKEAFNLGRSLSRGSECLPMAVTLGSLVFKLKETGSDGKYDAFLMPKADGPCRFGQYATLHRIILDKIGYKNLYIVSPCASNVYMGFNQSLRKLLWRAFLISDILYKLACMIRPYEVYKGETDRILDEEKKRFEFAFEKDGNLKEELKKSIRAFKNIKVDKFRKKPLVGIVGEIFVRCNIFSNDNLIRYIEKYGSEAWLTSSAEWILYTYYMQKWRAKEKRLKFMEKLKTYLKNKFIVKDEMVWYELGGDLVRERHEPSIEKILEEGMKYVPLNFEGEAILTVGRAVHFAKQGVNLIVNVSPFGCMPGSITSSIFQRIQNETGIPIVNIFYDGEEGQNKQLEIYLSQL
ncbi:MAG: acyl-CoA dehydratase activase [Acidobacteriota bacterium]